MAKDFLKTAQGVLENIGGKENIQNVVHCVTRLRFNLSNYDLANIPKIKTISGVLGCVMQSGQLQVIIGQEVASVYAELCTQAGISTQKPLAENLDKRKTEKPNEKPKGVKKLNAIFDVFAGVFAPIVPAFAGAGIIKGVITILSSYGAFANHPGALLICNAIGDSVFYFCLFWLPPLPQKSLTQTKLWLLQLPVFICTQALLAAQGKR